MTRTSLKRAGLILGLIAAPACLNAAQAGPFTGTGGGPETTVNAPYRSSVGQTVPPGRAAAPLHDPNERTKRQKELDSVLGSVCDAC
ncbi:MULTISPECIES: hypothetical protein [Methylobacterium]|jgi:hypothetical protein|uniref:hypothetical protein n=1 Tax=Methylobacterium TaxID=407 RepID=UPI0011CA9D1E|nr:MULTISPECIES: hypothetical protein [Methylobacterium]TXN42572.1 hypothetical protein FV233_22145 [Methylobacterium sp. WL7]TXN71029.1 hypothetical protein FV228_11905 [Methylobacterium sp. WL18]GJE24655.1 hypothetical protein JHFBIEKO_5133 [Methylobacterium mesophilicum]